MNKTIISKTSEKLYKVGDLFIDPMVNELYILSSINSVDNRFISICLNDGSFWKDASEFEEEAIEGLEFVGRNATITIS